MLLESGTMTRLQLIETLARNPDCARMSDLAIVFD